MKRYGLWSGAPDCGGCVTSTREGFLEDSQAEPGAERDQTFSQPCPLNTHFSRGFRRYASLHFVFLLWVEAALSMDGSKPGASVNRFTSPAAPPAGMRVSRSSQSSGPTLSRLPLNCVPVC